MRHVACLGMLAVLLFSSSLFWAQSNRATITGIVTDASGAVVPGADVSAINTATGVETRAVTNQEGLYSILNLPVGQYTISFSKSGFKKLDRAGVSVSVAQVLSLNVSLQVGATTENVVVTGDVPLLQTETADVGTTLKGNALTDLPLSIYGGRQVETFAFAITPGVQGDPYTAIINGTQGFTKEVLIDGTSQTAQIQGDAIESGPSMEAVEEFKAQTSGIGGSSASTNGGVISFNMKSGTNSFHGSAFGFLHNELFDSNTWDNNHAGLPKTKARFFDYGFSAGGPIIKNKTFIFGAFERYQQKDFTLGGYDQTVPVPAFLNGDFSALLNPAVVLGTDAEGNTIYQGAIFDPANPGVVFPGNIIDPSRISSVSQKILDIYQQGYAPEREGLVENNRIPNSNSPSQTPIQISIKVDHNLSEKNRVAGSWIYNHRPRTLVDAGGIWQMGTEDGGPLANSRSQEVVSNNYRVSDSYTITPNLLNVLSITYNEYKNASVPVAGGDWPSQLGFGDTGAPNFPAIDFGASRNGKYTTAIGNAWQGNYIGDTFYINNDLSWIKGRHTIKMGGEFRAAQLNSHSGAGTLHFSFSPNQTGDPMGLYVSDTNQVGFGFASFLLGEVQSASEDTPWNLYGRRKGLALYLGDDVKVSSKLTINADLRWQVTFPFHEKYGHWANFDLNAIDPNYGIPGTMKFANGGGDSFEKNMDWKEFAPHIGAAYQLTSKTVLRGAYGIYYAPIGMNYWQGVPYGFAPGFRGTNQVTQTSDFSPAFNWTSGYPGVFVPGTPDPSYIPWGPVNIDPDSLKAGYTHQFNIGAQYEVMRDLLIDVSYIGNRGRRLHDSSLRFNEPSPNVYMGLVNSDHYWDWIYDATSAADAGVPYPYEGFGGYAYQAIAPYPQAALTYSPIYYVGTPLGRSSYNALQIEAIKRTGHGLTADFSYTLSQSKGNSVTNFGETWASGGLQDYADINADADTLTGYDQKHVFKGYFTYDLPLGRGRKWASGATGVVDKLVGGWTLSGTLNYSSGLPITVYAPTSLYAWPSWSATYPNINMQGDFSRKFSASEFQNSGKSLYFDPSLYSDPGYGQLGTGKVRIDQLRGFGGASENASIAKAMAFGANERFRLSLRFELYNLFNRHFYSYPITDMSDSRFGQVTSISSSGRQGQVGARFQW